MFCFWAFFTYAAVASVLANRAFPPVKVIKLTLGVSKATYLPLKGNKFIQNGAIMGNPSTIVPRFFGLIPLPPKYDPTQDEVSCSMKKWTARSYEYKETEIIMFTNTLQKLVVFGFRGTEAYNLIDWYRNFKMYPTYTTIDKTLVKLHKGFNDRYSFIAPWFETEYKNVPPNYTIIITGHSLGGAEATIAAVHAAGKLKRKPHAVITYGSPLVGAGSFKNYYDQVVGCDRSLRMTAKGDWFTNVPELFGYTHVCDKTEVDGHSGIDWLKAHDLYGGYERGIQRKYRNANEINFGCDKLL